MRIVSDQDVCGAVDVAHLPPEATTALGRIVRRLAAVSQRQPTDLDSLTLIRYSPEAICELSGGQAGAHIIYVFLDGTHVLSVQRDTALPFRIQGSRGRALLRERWLES